MTKQIHKNQNLIHNYLKEIRIMPYDFSVSTLNNANFEDSRSKNWALPGWALAGPPLEIVPAPFGERLRWQHRRRIKMKDKKASQNQKFMNWEDLKIIPLNS